MLTNLEIKSFATRDEQGVQIPPSVIAVILPPTRRPIRGDPYRYTSSWAPISSSTISRSVTLRIRVKR